MQLILASVTLYILTFLLTVLTERLNPVFFLGIFFICIALQQQRKYDIQVIRTISSDAEQCSLFRENRYESI